MSDRMKKSSGSSDSSNPIGLEPDTLGAASEAPQGRKKKTPSEDWKILGNLSKGDDYPILPKKHEGIMSKRRKWPMKGWHKRYFILDRGILTYGKTALDIRRGRTHGKIDVGSAVVSAKAELLRIDIDDEEYIHHIKVNNKEAFEVWLDQLKQHRLYQQHQSNISPPNEENNMMTNPTSTHTVMSPRNSLPRGMRPPLGMIQQPSWSNDLGQMDENMTSRLLNVQQKAVNLALLAQKIEDEQNAALGGHIGVKSKKLFGLRKKKSNNSSSKATATTPSQENQHFDPETTLSSASSSLASMSNLSTSNPTLSVQPSHVGTSGGTVLSRNSVNLSSLRPTSLPQDNKNEKVSSTLPSTPTHVNVNLHLDEILTLAQDVQTDVSALMRTYTADRDRLKQTLEQLNHQNNNSSLDIVNKSSTLGGASNYALVASLRQSLHQALQQNSVLRAKLQKIHLDSDLGEMTSPQDVNMPNVDTLTRGLNPSLSYSSSCVSEFFDAREYSAENNQNLPSDYNSSDEDSDSDTESSSMSDDDDDEFVEASNLPTSPSSGTLVANSSQEHTNLGSETSNVTQFTGRREKLPVPKADAGGINLWNLLCKNIGKDLSKISMPVTLNEPLSALQRLCEELEYSELLDKASKPNLSEIERMTWVAAFAVSVYGSCQARAGYKPFNPLLGETFECSREDRRFRYVAEQVSHHPPISACFAESLDGYWTWQQNLRVKTKFWGKSMEFQPEGEVSLTLNCGTDEVENKQTYTWNKITTCIHNLFGGDESRYVDLYGQLVIKSKSLTCKIEFVKASYWSNKRHELYGTITDKSGKVLQHLFGKWSEALYIGQGPSAKCIWRPAMLPADSQIYYGFSRFAIELNELIEAEKKFLPPTDTRFRPDQRMLEEGQISEAETMKLKLEQSQRERRTAMDLSGRKHTPKWFNKTRDSGKEEDFKYNGQYWPKRNSPGFKNILQDFVKLW